MARQAEQDPTNLYIANLPHSVKESDLETMFSPYGQVGVILITKIIISIVVVIFVTMHQQTHLILLSQQGGVDSDPTRHEPAISGSRICQDGKSRQVRADNQVNRDSRIMIMIMMALIIIIITMMLILTIWTETSVLWRCPVRASHCL